MDVSQDFECKEFIWEVMPGALVEDLEKGDRKRRRLMRNCDRAGGRTVAESCLEFWSDVEACLKKYHPEGKRN